LEIGVQINLITLNPHGIKELLGNVKNGSEWGVRCSIHDNAFNKLIVKYDNLFLDETKTEIRGKVTLVYNFTINALNECGVQLKQYIADNGCLITELVSL
jgi:hypothetical protein